MGDVVDLFGGLVARLYRLSFEDQGFEVLMMTVFDITARQGYAVARSIVKDLAAAPNIPLPEAWRRVLRHVGPAELKEFLAPDEEEKWRRGIETKMGETTGHALAPETLPSRPRAQRDGR